MVNYQHPINHNKYFFCAEGRSSFADHLIEKGHEIKNTQDIITIVHKEINDKKICVLEEIEISKFYSMTQSVAEMIRTKEYHSQLTDCNTMTRQKNGGIILRINQPFNKNETAKGNVFTNL